MSSRNGGRPPGRGGRTQPGSAQPPRPRWLRAVPDEPDEVRASRREPATSAFDDPDLSSPKSWALPAARGRYRGIELSELDPADADDLTILIEAQHPEFEDAIRESTDAVIGGRTVNPRLHVRMHRAVLSQVLATDPPEAWATVQRLAGLGYDWHTIIHMIMSVLSRDRESLMSSQVPLNTARYGRRLSKLPGDWPPPGS